MVSRSELEQQVARMLCVGFAGAELDDDLRALLDRGVGGIILYERNVGDLEPDQVAELIRSIKAYARRPVFIAVDHEGGDFTRLRRGFTELPPMRALGNLGNTATAEALGRLIGRELRCVGVDACLGPVLDVDTNPNNPIIGLRSISRDPGTVARLGTAFASGMQAEGVAACGKHFPGHGDTSIDSNLDLPLLPHDMERLESVELPPFEAAVRAHMPGIVAAHVMFAPIDRNLPASMSRPVLYGLLRAKMGFRGIVICDDVDMSAVKKSFGLTEVAVQGVNASVDVFLCGRHPESAYTLIDAVSSALEDGRLLPERVLSANRRITAFVHRYTRPDEDHPDLTALRSEEHLALAERLQEALDDDTADKVPAEEPPTDNTPADDAGRGD